MYNFFDITIIYNYRNNIDNIKYKKNINYY